MSTTKRKDKSRVVLRKGEYQRANGTYNYSWTDSNGKRHFVYAKTLEELRIKEEQIEKDKSDGIKAEARYTTLNDLFDLWKTLKRGLKDNTFQNYTYMYDTFVRHVIGDEFVTKFNKSDIKRFYNYLADDGKQSLLEVKILTGRSHQIRLQLANIGHSLVGDVKYGKEKGMTSKLGLWAGKLAFDHPTTKERMVFMACPDQNVLPWKNFRMEKYLTR